MILQAAKQWWSRHRRGARLAGLGWVLLYGLLTSPQLLAQQAVVHGVLFYSPTCPHCHKVIGEDLPPLLRKYGERLQLAALNVRTKEGQALYRAVVDKFGLGKDRQGVPALVIGDRVLVGAEEIPRVLPGLIEQLLAAGGIGWPAIPGLSSILQQAVEATGAGEPAAASGWAGMRERFVQDPTGNGLAVAVLVVMVATLVWVLAGLKRSAATPPGARPGLELALLTLLGLGVAGYLAFVEVAQADAVCGPVGDCNSVQQSEHARLFGVLPLGVLGLVGYLDILAGWALARTGRGRAGELGWGLMFVSALVGTLFSAYLTFLEPFVIGATCMWCLGSALIMTFLLWRTKDAGAAAVVRLIGVRRAPQGPAG
jgi:uncharacterized membrane protein